MATDWLQQHPKVKALQAAFGSEVKLQGAGPNELKNCLFVRGYEIEMASGSKRKRLVIQALGADGRPIEPPSRYRGPLVQIVPELAPQLAAGETAQRRKNLKMMLDHLQGSEYAVAIESLDPKRPVIYGSQTDARAPSTLPDLLTWIDVSQPEEPRRVFLFVEKTVGSLDGGGKAFRVDHTIVHYKMSQSEITAVKEADGSYRADFKTYADGRTVTAVGTKIRATDANGFIGNAAAVEHHKKTVDGGLATANWLNQHLGIRFEGPVEMTAVDHLKNPNEVRINEGPTGERGHLGKTNPEGQSGSFRTVSTATIEFSYQQNRIRSATLLTREVVRALSSFSVEHIEAIQDHLATLHRHVNVIDAERKKTVLRKGGVLVR